MRLIPGSGAGSTRSVALLAPRYARTSSFFDVAVDAVQHRRLLTEAQKLRGRVYLQDGAIEPWQLSVDGRHVQKADYQSWHLLSLDDRGHVLACTRYLPHHNAISFSDLNVAHSALAKSEAWGWMLRKAIEEELVSAKERKCTYVEMGGWVIAEQLRCSTEAVRMVLTAYGLAQVLGGALGISTVTRRHYSSSILRRIGGASLVLRGIELPAYYDPQYKCEMEILRFDSEQPNARYREHVDECRAFLSQVRVVCAEPAHTDFNTSLQQLQVAVASHRASPVPAAAWD